MATSRRTVLAGLVGAPALAFGGEPLQAAAQEKSSEPGPGSSAGRPVLHVPARDIPIPTSLSPAAQAQMARTISARNAANSGSPGLSAPSPAGQPAAPRQPGAATPGIPDVDVQQIEVNGVPIYVATPAGIAANDRAVFLDVHGGGLVSGGGEANRRSAAGMATMMNARVWSIDYRMPPEHPYPAGLDDCVAAYRKLLGQRKPSEIIVGGGSAGGNLAAALILRARDEGLPLPVAAFLGTPEVDLTESGDSFQTNNDLDTVLSGSLMKSNLLYAGGHDLSHPYLSPLFGDFTKGFPPTYLMSGTRDLFLSNAVRMHCRLRAAGVYAELYIIEAGSHGGFGGAPENDAFNRDVRRFVNAHWGKVRAG